MNIRDIPEHLRRHRIDLGATGTCLYASAGGDGRVLSFTHPEFMAERGAGAVPEIGLYVLLDRNTPRDEEALRDGMGDERTSVDIHLHEAVRAHGIDGELFAMTWHSVGGRFRDRTVAVLMLRTENEAAAPAFHRAGWVPDLFVGVCDGCGFGGNLHCVNRLTTWGQPPAVVRQVPVPRWWITDHFQDAAVPNPLEQGGVVRSIHEGFPYAFRKVALLSAAWGHYGHGPLPGATVFELTEVS